jgi:transposase
LLELPYCNTECFQLFIQELSEQSPTELKLLVLDNGSFHKSKRLIIPDNIILVFLPPYSPELNPAEKIWWQIKQEFVCKTFEDINELSKYLCRTVRNVIKKEIVKRICSFKYLMCHL